MRAQVPPVTHDPVQVDGYRVVRRLAEGGQGVVYLAEGPDGEPVALKLLHPAWLAEPTSRERLVKEIAAARTVARFCVAQVLDARTDGDTPYVVSEFVEGPSLSQHVRERGVLAGAALDRLAVATATALAAIHRARIVHRDLKPSNVMLGPDGPRVIDFGIARDLSLDATSVGRIVGSPNYMSPEQLSGAVVGPKADVFSWGCTLVYAATGRAPFTADDLVALMYKVVHDVPDTSGVPQPLRAVVDRCLAKDPAQRPTSQELLLALLGGRDEDDADDADDAAERDGADDAAGPDGGAVPGVPVPGVPDDPTLPTSLLARATALPEGSFPAADVPSVPTSLLARAAAVGDGVAPVPGAAVPHALLTSAAPAAPPAARSQVGPPSAPLPPSAPMPFPVPAHLPSPPPTPPPPPPPPSGRGPGAPADAPRRSRSGGVLAAVAAVAVVLLATGAGLFVRDRAGRDPQAGSAPAAAPLVAPQPVDAETAGASPTSPAAEPTGPEVSPSTPDAAPSASTRPPRTPAASRTPGRTPSRTPARTTTTAVRTGIPATFAGTWTGTASQPNGLVPTYDLTMRLPQGAQRGTISSSTLGCTGRVIVLGAPTAQVLRLKSVATDTAEGTCAGSGSITMTKRAPNRASWTWVDDAEPTNVATAVLTR